MHIITCHDWTDTDDYKRAWAPTSDPRVLAVIERDEYASLDTLFDGDGINPILAVDSRGWGVRFDHVAGYDGGEAEIMTAAFERFGNGTAQRYLWIFHGIAAEDAGNYQVGNYVVVTSKAAREEWGQEDPATYDEAREQCKPVADEVDKALDGYVYGVGFATLEERVLEDDEPIDLADWDINIYCWGFVGQEYAQLEAGDGGYGDLPELPELLTIEGAR